MAADDGDNVPPPVEHRGGAVESGVVVTTNVVIGAGSGMGEAVARRLAGAGPLVLVDRNREALEAKAAELGVDSGDVVVKVLDITDRDAVYSLAAEVGDLGALVLTAGLSPTMGDCTAILRVNLLGTAHVLDAFLPHASQNSVAVCFASIAGHGEIDPRMLDLSRRLAVDEIAAGIDPSLPQLTRSAAAYAISKRGVIDLVRRAAPAWGLRGARVLSLSPGIIATPMGRQEEEQQPVMADMLAATPLGRHGRAEEIAAVVAFLCSADASYMTGCDILVDGGFNATVSA